jgi:hypothetical protein
MTEGLKHLFQYGALGVVCACFLGFTGYAMQSLMPLWVEYYKKQVATLEEAQIAQRSQTELIRQTRTAMQDMVTEMKNGTESTQAQISRTCSRRR